MKSSDLASLVANPSKIKEIAAKLFHEIDLNKDMKIDLHEFQVGFWKIFPECPPADKDNIAKAIFEKMDSNETKSITLDQLELFLTFFIQQQLSK